MSTSALVLDPVFAPAKEGITVVAVSGRRTLRLGQVPVGGGVKSMSGNSNANGDFEDRVARELRNGAGAWGIGSCIAVKRVGNSVDLLWERR